MTLSVTRPTLLTDYYLRRAREAPAAAAFHSLIDGRWRATAWGDFIADAERIADGLAELGLRRGDRLGIIAPTGLAWEWFQLAALLNGAAVVGLDAHDQPERLLAIAKASELGALVVADASVLTRLDYTQVPSLRFGVTLNEDPPPLTWPTRWVSLAALRAQPATTAARQGPAPDSLATVVFTSGSTGAPKGIGYTHAQVCLAIDSILSAFPEITARDRLVCWLPLSNLFQRMLNFCAAGRGAQSYFVSDPRAIVTHLPAIRPHVFIAVPRFFEKLNEGITQRLAQQSAPARRLVQWALDVGGRVAESARSGRSPGPWLACQHTLAEQLVLRKLREVMGGEVRFMVSGSAAFPRWLLEKFHAMGLLVLEAYGLSENVVPIAINRLGAYRFGSVGQVLDGNSVRIAEDGEVLVRGAGVFNGYLGGVEPAAIDADGFLATGDLGVLDATGFLTLVGRKSEIFKTSTGRKIAPIAVEARLKRIEGVDQIVLVGAGRKVTAALVTVLPTADGNPISSAQLGEWARRIADAVPAALAEEADYARPAGLAVTRRAFGIDNGELTSNLKLRRKVIETNYRPALEALFDRLDAGRVGFCEPISEDIVVVSCEGK